MLGFLRKHQKIFLGTVAFFMTISMVFFGTMGGGMRGPKAVPDRQIGELMDGSPLMEKELGEMTRLLSMGEWGKTPNLLSGNWMENEILLSGLGEAIVDEHFEELKGDLQEKWQRVRSYMPYRHPYAPQISARAVWEKFAPSIPGLLDQARGGPEEFGREQVGLLFALYRAQSEFPPHLLHQMLYYSQGEGMRQDPGLPHANVSLFGFRSCTDWFGTGFEKVVSEVVLNGALMAKEQGVRVNEEKALAGLYANVQAGLKEIGQDAQDARGVLNYMLNQKGLTRERAAVLWGKAMAFSHLMGQVGESVEVDRLALEQFNDFSKEKLKVKRFALPKELLEGEKLASYLEIVADECEGLPTMYRDPKVVMLEHPELVYRSVEVETRKVDRDQILSRIPLKETWAFERSDEGFAKLQAEFSNLKGVDDLEGLDTGMRYVVDQRARELIVEAHPEWVEEARANAEVNRKWIKVAPGEEFKGEVVDDSGDWVFYTFEEALDLGLLEEEEASAEEKVAAHVEKARELLQEGRELDLGQWSLVESEELIRESSLKVGEVSPVEGDSFFQVVEELEVGPSAEQIERARDALARDAKKAFLLQLMRD